MAIKNKSTLKTYFQAGKRPTQQNFSDLIDSFAHLTDTSSYASYIEPIPIDPSITTADIGKLAMLDYDGNVKIYQEDAERSGTLGQWKLTFLSLSESWIKFYYNDLGREVDIFSPSWTNSATTPEEEATNFMNHINYNHDYALSAASGANANEVILTQANPFFMEDENDIVFSGTNITIEELQEPIAYLPLRPKRLCLGLIKHVDVVNNLGYFDNIYVVEAENAPDILSVLGELEVQHFQFQLLALLKLVAMPASNGKVRGFDFDSIFDFGDPSYAISAVHNAMYIFLKPHNTPGKYYIMKRLLG